jgi:hypothetical protein
VNGSRPLTSFSRFSPSKVNCLPRYHANSHLRILRVLLVELLLYAGTSSLLSVRLVHVLASISAFSRWPLPSLDVAGYTDGGRSIHDFFNISIMLVIVDMGIFRRYPLLSHLAFVTGSCSTSGAEIIIGRAYLTPLEALDNTN